MESYLILTSDSAQKDIENQFAWFYTNRGFTHAMNWYEKTSAAINGLAHWPVRWQKVWFNGQRLHRMLVDSNTLVFYTIDEKKKHVIVNAIRGAAEDWSNQAIPGD